MGVFVCGPYLQTVFEAVGRRLISVLTMILPALAEEECTLIQEQVPLHGFEACKLLHPCRAPFMTDPHTEGALHQDSAQITQLTLSDTHPHKTIYFNPEHTTYCIQY